MAGHHCNPFVIREALDQSDQHLLHVAGDSPAAAEMACIYCDPHLKGNLEHRELTGAWHLTS